MSYGPYMLKMRSFRNFNVINKILLIFKERNILYKSYNFFEKKINID